MPVLEINFTTYIPTTILGLLGLISGYLFFYFKAKSDNNLEELKSLNERDRLPAVQMRLNELGVRLPTLRDLSPEQKLELLRDMMRSKNNRYLIGAVTLLILAALLTFLVWNNSHGGIDTKGKTANEIYEENLATLQTATSETSSLKIVDFFTNEFIKGSDISHIIKKNPDRLLNSLSQRLGSTTSNQEIDKIYRITAQMNTLGYVSSENALECLNNGTVISYNLCKKYLGNLLLEGYKAYLSNHGHFKPKPVATDTKEIYEWLLQVSDKNTLKANTVLAQFYLAEQNVLGCTEKIQEVIKSKIGWQFSPDGLLNKIPVVTFLKTLAYLQNLSPFRDTLFTSARQMFEEAKQSVAAFHLKLKKLREDSLSSSHKDWTSKAEEKYVFNYPIFTYYQHDAACTIFNYTYVELESDN
jgi:hypothetical protein